MRSSGFSKRLGRLGAGILALALAFCAAGCRREQSPIPQTQTPGPEQTAGTEPSEPASTDPSGRFPADIVIDLTPPAVDSAAVLKAVPAGLPDDPEAAVAHLMGVSREQMEFDEQYRAMGWANGKISGENDTLYAMVMFDRRYWLTAEREVQGTQVGSQLLKRWATDMGEGSDPHAWVYDVPKIPAAGELPGLPRQEALAALREALAPFGLPLSEEPLVMRAVTDEYWEAIYETLNAEQIAREETSEGVPGRFKMEHYKPGQASYYIVWEGEAEGIPVLGSNYDGTVTTVPEGVSVGGGLLCILADEKGIRSLDSRGTFFRVVEKGEMRELMPTGEAMLTMARKAQSDRTGNWTVRRMRFGYVAVPLPEEEGTVSLIPCWAGEASFGTPAMLWKLYLMDAVTGEFLE